MATYVLDGKSAATLARRPLAARLAVSGAPNANGVRLVARTPDGVPSDAVVETAPTMLIIPHVTEEIVLGAVPQGRELFAPGTTVHMSIGPDTNAEFDADVAQLTAVEGRQQAPRPGPDLVAAPGVSEAPEPGTDAAGA